MTFAASKTELETVYHNLKIKSYSSNNQDAFAMREFTETESKTIQFYQETIDLFLSF